MEMNNAAFGSYIETYSLIHRLNAKVKFIGLIILMIVGFMNIDIEAYMLLTVCTITLLALIRLPLVEYKQMFRPIVYFVSFIAIFNLVFSVPSGKVYFEFLFIKISEGSIISALQYSYRIAVIFLLGSVFSISTKPLDFAYGFEDLLSPLKRLKVPVAEIALMLSLTLRFIPILFEESQVIQKAQMARGADLEHGSFKAKIKGLIAMLIPMFIVSFMKAEKMALAMEARGFTSAEHRTRYQLSKLTKKDYMSLVIVALVALLIALFQMQIITIIG